MYFSGFAEGMASFKFSEGDNETIMINHDKAKKLMAIACEKGKQDGNEMYCFE